MFTIFMITAVCIIPQPVEGRGSEAERVIERRQWRGQLRGREAEWEQRVRGCGQLREVSTILIDVQQRMTRPGLGLGQEAVTRLGGRVRHAGDIEGRGPGRDGGRGGGAGHRDEVTILSLRPLSPSSCLIRGCLPGLLQEVGIRLKC